MQKIDRIFDRHNECIYRNIKYISFFTSLNDLVDAIVGFLLAPGINNVRSFLAFSEVYRLYIGTIIFLKILFVFWFHWENFADKHLVSELQSNILNILQE